MQVQQERPNFETRSGLIRAEPNNQQNCVEQVHTTRPNQLISEQAEPDHPDYPYVVLSQDITLTGWE